MGCLNYSEFAENIISSKEKEIDIKVTRLIGEKDLDIKVKINPLHNTNYYLDVDFEGINIENAKEVFGEFAKDLDKPLQIMLSSRETERIAILKVAGFVCKRKCYEVKAQEQDYIGGKGEGNVHYSQEGEVGRP